MNDTIKIKSGSLGNRTAMPNLTEDELGYQKDEKALYIGDGKSNVRLCGANDVPGMNNKIADNDTRISKTETEIDKIKADIAEVNRALLDINSRLDALTSTNQ